MKSGKLKKAIDTLRKWYDLDFSYDKETAKVYKPILDYFDSLERDYPDMQVESAAIQARDMVRIADSLLDGKTRKEALKDYPSEKDYWRKVGEEFLIRKEKNK